MGLTVLVLHLPPRTTEINQQWWSQTLGRRSETSDSAKQFMRTEEPQQFDLHARRSLCVNRLLSYHICTRPAPRGIPTTAPVEWIVAERGKEQIRFIVVKKG